MVEPTATPVTIPVLLLMVAASGFEELQTIVPTAVVLNAVVPPVPMLFVPVMAGVAGGALTVMLAVLPVVAVVQPTELIVTVVDPAVANAVVVKVPVLPAATTMVALVAA